MLYIHILLTVLYYIEGVSVTSVILAPGACGIGGPSRGSCHHLRPSGRFRHEFQKRRSCCYTQLARSEDPFVRCAGCGVGQGRGAPVHARAPRNQRSSEKHI